MLYTSHSKSRCALVVNIERIPRAAARANAESLLCGGNVALPITRAFARDTSTGKFARAAPREVIFSFEDNAPWLITKKHVNFDANIKSNLPKDRVKVQTTIP